MKTKEQQRAEILKRLWWMKKYQDERASQWDGSRLRDLVYLKRVIRKAMEIEPIGVKCVKMPSHFGNYIGYAVPCDVFSDEDNNKVDTVISRMEAQGFIKLIEMPAGYTLVEVLKTK